MKKIYLSIFASFLLSGCAFLSQNTPRLNEANFLKSEVVKYQRNSKFDYVYTLKNLSNSEIYEAKASKYHYAPGDVAYVNIKNGLITDMKLVSKKFKPSSSQAYKNDEISRKVLKKNQNIAVPQSESISF